MLGAVKDVVLRHGPVRFFVIMAAIFGIAFVIITPPFQGADEIVHFYRVYQISEGNFVVDSIKGGAGGNLPTSLGQIVSATDAANLEFYPQHKYHTAETRHAASVRLNASHKKSYDFSATAQYSPLAYLPSATAVAAGRVFQARPIALFYMARLADLVFLITAIAFGIRFLPRKKWALVAIGLLPMMLFQGATINADAVTIGSLVLFLTFILKLREKTAKITWLEVAILLLMGILMAMSKQIMFVFLPLVLLLGNDRLPISKRLGVWLKLGLMAIPFACFLAWFWFVHSIDVSAAYFNHQNPTAQAHFIIRSPESFVNVLWNTYFYNWGDTITRSFIGDFGWLDTPLAENIVVVGYVGLALLMFASVEGQKLTKAWLSAKERLLVWGMVLFYLLAISASLYLYFTPVGFKIIVGLQGRYYLPIVLLLVPLLYGNSIRVSQRLYRNVAIGLPVFLLVCSVITIYVRYFIHNV